MADFEGFEEEEEGDLLGLGGVFEIVLVGGLEVGLVGVLGVDFALPLPPDLDEAEEEKAEAGSSSTSDPSSPLDPVSVASSSSLPCFL